MLTLCNSRISLSPFFNLNTVSGNTVLGNMVLGSTVLGNTVLGYMVSGNNSAFVDA